ncbi:MAG: PQQ-binding-like beta-propeller repeat protein, partial [Rhodospirillales bacterium]|nr:PQQ-binding-like beta-propeller repeat protein [Rhodospirillales bacterium]
MEIQRTALIVLLLLTPNLQAEPFAATPSREWPTVGNDRGNMQYSPLDLINRTNVSKLDVAWTYSTGEAKDGKGRIIECTPIVVDGVLYLTTAYLKVVALDAASGEELWVFDPFPNGRKGIRFASGGVNRGCAYWTDGESDGERRILHGTSNGQLYSIDARTGKLDPKFGDAGVLDLRAGLEGDLSRVPYGPTSAPAICGDRIVIGVSNGEHAGLAAPGDIRAFDVRNGEALWRFHTVPRPGEFGHDTWPTDATQEAWKNRGGVNAWGGVSIDPIREWVFVGLGSASYDFYGSDRHGKNLFANCVVALDGKTGKRIWHFQTLHHDLWDHDLPTYPNLMTLQRDGKRIDAAVQVTKTGYAFVFDRET